MEETIYKNQNNEDILLLQFSQSKNYDRAEYLNNIYWILAIITSLIGNVNIIKIWQINYQILIIAILTVTIVYIQKEIHKSINIGANTKELIDRSLYLFSLELNDLDYTKDDLIRFAVQLKNKYPSEYVIKTNNTGNDNPIGKRDWYTEVKSNNHVETILNCQKENAWWDKILSKQYIQINIIILFFLGIILYFFFNHNTIQEFSIIVLSNVALFVKIIMDIPNYIKIRDCSVSIKTTIDNIQRENNITEKSLITLQSYIFNRRKIKFLPSNFLHNFLARKLHNLWIEENKYKKTI